MTGNPQLTERQETLLRQAEKCRELASRLRAWKGHYDQNCAFGCVFVHMNRICTNKRQLGIIEIWELVGFTRDYPSLDQCAHDGTPTGAAAWLDKHAEKLEAQL